MVTLAPAVVLAGMARPDDPMGRRVWRQQIDVITHETPLVTVNTVMMTGRKLIPARRYPPHLSSDVFESMFEPQLVRLAAGTAEHIPPAMT